MNTTLMWQKDERVGLDPAVQDYLAGEDVKLDAYLLPFDIEATIAHVRGLASIKAITDRECQTLVESLQELNTLHERGEFVLDERFEDGHGAIEAFLSERLGEVGRKVHLGRSRNDQVLVAQRLFMRDMLQRIQLQVGQSAQACLDIAASEQFTPLPGYTHLQRAVPSTVGLWMAGFAEAFIDDAVLLEATKQWLNTNPLGAAAGFGVNLPLDRDLTTQLLGFERPMINPMYAQNSRGKHEFQALSACWQVLQDVRRLAWDLSLFASSEFDFVHMTDAVTTGSSIMPNKRNPDLVEVMRAASGPIAGCMTELQQCLSLPSGYHRDLQLTKPPIIRGLRHTLRTVELVPVLLSAVSFNRESMLRAIDSNMCATDRAVELALAGVPFRDAYQQVAATVSARPQPCDPSESIKARTSPGACADLRLDTLRRRLASVGA